MPFALYQLALVVFAMGTSEFHARWPRARHLNILRRFRGDRWSPDIGIRRGDGDRRTGDGCVHSSPPRESDTLRLRARVRAVTCRRCTHAGLHCPVHHARDRGDRQCRLLGGRAGRGDETRGTRCQRPGRGGSAGGYHCRDRRRRSRGCTAGYGTRLAVDVLGDRSSLCPRSDRHCRRLHYSNRRLVKGRIALALALAAGGAGAADLPAPCPDDCSLLPWSMPGPSPR